MAKQKNIMKSNEKSIGELVCGEPHPMAYEALQYIKSFGMLQMAGIREGMASCAISGNRAAEVCHETLRRIFAGEPVSDRYVLGLAWMIKHMMKDIEGEANGQKTK